MGGRQGGRRGGHGGRDEVGEGSRARREGEDRVPGLTVASCQVGVEEGPGGGAGWGWRLVQGPGRGPREARRQDRCHAQAGTGQAAREEVTRALPQASSRTAPPAMAGIGMRPQACSLPRAESGGGQPRPHVHPGEPRACPAAQLPGCTWTACAAPGAERQDPASKPPRGHQGPPSPEPPQKDGGTGSSSRRRGDKVPGERRSLQGQRVSKKRSSRGPAVPCAVTKDGPG